MKAGKNDTTDFFTSLKRTYDLLKSKSKTLNLELPKNLPGKNGNADLFIRKLDCLVIQTAHELLKEARMDAYDTVRGLFFEGKKLYPNAGFKEKNHIQICVRNPNCIKGYFLPRKPDKNYPIP